MTIEFVLVTELTLVVLADEVASSLRLRWTSASSCITVSGRRVVSVSLIEVARALCLDWGSTSTNGSGLAESSESDLECVLLYILLSLRCHGQHINASQSSTGK